MHTSKKKILFVITKSNWGGAQRYVYDIATSLPQDKFTPVVALGGNGILARKLREAGVRVIPLLNLERDINPFGDISSFFDLLNIFKKERPDVVHLNSSKIGGLGALSARLAHVPRIIFTSHGWAFNEERPFISRFIIKTLSWITVLLAHKTIAVSETVRTDTRFWSFIKNKVITIHNGIEEAELISQEEARDYLLADTEFCLPPRAIIIGTIGELHKNKGLAYAIKAIAEIVKQNPSVFYFIIGEGEERARLEKLIQQHEVEDNIFLLGFVENAGKYLRAFDIFVLPSVKEGLPYVLLEAGSAKLPLVASYTGGIPEIVLNEETGLLAHPRDIQGFREALERLVVSPSLRETLSAELHQKVTREFSLEKSVAKTCAIYKD